MNPQEWVAINKNRKVLHIICNTSIKKTERHLIRIVRSNVLHVLQDTVTKTTVSTSVKVLITMKSLKFEFLMKNVDFPTE